MNSFARRRTDVMRMLGLMAALVLAMAACSDTTSETPTEPTPVTTGPSSTASTAAPTATSTTAAPVPTTTVDGEFIGTPVQISAISFSEGYVEITNFGDEPVTLDGWWLCQRPNYHAIATVELETLESIRIPVDEASFGSISPSTGEIGLYNSNSFGSADAIRSYVEWGNSGHGRSATAVQAGIWTEGGFVVTTDATTVLLNSSFAISPEGWFAQ